MSDELKRDCSTKAGLSYQIDELYSKGSGVLCSASCPCTANKNLWPVEVQKGMVTDSSGGNDYSDCPSYNPTLY